MPGKQSIRAYGIKVTSGPMATIYQCPCCKHTEMFRNGQHGTGRGHGLRMGGGCYSRMVAHVRKEHPDQPKERPAPPRLTMFTHRRELIKQKD